MMMMMMMMMMGIRMMPVVICLPQRLIHALVLQPPFPCASPLRRRGRRIYMYICEEIHTFRHANIQKNMCIYMHMCIYIYIYICFYIHMQNIYIHTYIYIYIYMYARSRENDIPGLAFARAAAHRCRTANGTSSPLPGRTAATSWDSFRVWLSCPVRFRSTQPVSVNSLSVLRGIDLTPGHICLFCSTGLKRMDGRSLFLRAWFRCLRG